MPQHIPCPELEELAAWADGRLDDRRRQEIVAHLDRCPDCYDLAAGAVAFRQEVDARAMNPADAPVRAFRAVSRWAVPAAAAAMLLLAAAFVALAPVQVAAPAPAMVVESTPVAPVTEPAPVPAPPDPAADGDGAPTEMIRPGGVLAGIRKTLTAPGADSAAWSADLQLPDDAAYGFSGTPATGWFRLGVTWVDGERSAQAGNRTAAADRLADIRNDLNRLVTGAELQVEYARAEAAIRGTGAVMPAELFERTLAAAGQRGAVRMELGAWVQGGRIAARAGDRGYFKAAEMDRLQAGLAAATCPPGVAAAFDEIRRQAGAGFPNAAAFRRADRALVDIALLMRGE